MVKLRSFLTVYLVFIASNLCNSSKTAESTNNHEAKSTKNTKDLKTLRRAAAMGIGFGMMKVHKKMESNVLKLYEDFIKTVNNSKASENVSLTKLNELEKTMRRDKYAINILQNGLDLAMNTKTVRNYRQTLSRMALDEKVKKLDNPMDFNVKKVQDNVEKHLKFMRDQIGSVRKALKKVESNKKSKISFTSPKTTTQHPPHMNGIFNHDIVRLPQLLVPMIYEIDVESFYRIRRQNEEDSENNNKIDTSKESQEENFDEEFGPPSGGGGGGITGLIAGLSGGEGGSDVGALVGAISGLIANLFGPGGLDIPTLLSSGTSLIAGLLAGDENFGKVLADYIGIAVEGFSGGGGADNNGVFFGNFLGTLLASLSADPEEEEGPKPKLFFESFFKGFEQTKQKRGTDESSSSSGKGYFFEFISNIISSIVGGITNLLLNSSLGSSGGSSQGSADLSAGSSTGSSTGSSQASQSSMPNKHPESKPK